MKKLASCLIVFVVAAFVSTAAAVAARPHVSQQPGADPAATARFNALVERYFDAWANTNPSAATAAGLHAGDSRLEDYSHAGVERTIAQEQRFLNEATSIDARQLSQSNAIDLQLIINDARDSLLELTTIQNWRRNPDRYSSGISYSAFVLMSRKFDTPDARLRSLIEREKLMPAVFDAARANLRNPPKIFTDIAIEQLPGIVSFFQHDVPLAFNDVSDAGMLTEFQQSNQAVIDALNAYQAWLKSDLLPRSQGDFRLGVTNFKRKLEYEEMVDMPLARLLAVGMANLRLNQRRFAQVAHAIDATKTAAQELALIGHDHPPPDQLLQSFRDVLGGLRAFIEQHHIVSLPSQVMPILEETPPFERATTMASMDTPGPYEKKATEAYFNVTLPEKTWTQQQVDEHMAGFTFGTIISTAVHEALPGHYIQFLWVQHLPSKTRRLLGCSSNAEGWAHYCEQMMLDEGYGNGDKKLRLGQLQDALLRNARFIVGIEMHCGNMTFDQGVDFFMKEGYQSHANALRETKRGCGDPTYLYYTLGKLEILKLRDDYKREQGPRYTLQRFHDAFLAQGSPPIKLVRETLLQSPGSVL